MIHEVSYFRKGKRCVMLDFGNYVASGQGMDQVTVPGSWIFSRAIPARLREIGNGLNTAAHPARRLGFGVPDWFDRLEDERLVYRRNRQFSKAPDIVGMFVVFRGYS
jgi:hypothetical protein